MKISKEAEKKAFEIAYALCRIGKVSNNSFAESFYSSAILIIKSATIKKDIDIKYQKEFIEYLLALAASSEIIAESSAEVVIAELECFIKMKEEDEFSGVLVKEEEINNIFNKADKFKETQESAKPILLKNKNESRDNHLSGKNRQSAILEKIKQLGNVKLKDMQDFLPEVSERTIRYDLQKLVLDAAIERIGNGGPATFYRIKESGLVLPNYLPQQTA